jgi:hypothetical protein
LFSAPDSRLDNVLISVASADVPEVVDVVVGVAAVALLLISTTTNTASIATTIHAASI